jgi:hypothetical protein
VSRREAQRRRPGRPRSHFPRGAATRAPRARGRRGERCRPLRSHQRLVRRVPLTAAMLDSWLGSRSSPAAPPNSRVPQLGQRTAGKALCYQLPRLPGAGRRPESNRSRAKGNTATRKGTRAHRSAHSAGRPVGLPLQTPPAHGDLQ